MNAILLMSFCLGNIIGPETFIQNQGPNFLGAKIAIIVTCSIALVTAIILRTYYVWENRRRDKRAEVDGRLGVHVADSEFLDLTDWENKEFRYRL